MKNRVKLYSAFMVMVATMTSCKDFLDAMPDNRAEIDTEEKVEALLVSAYPDHDYNLLTEYMSDNVDDMGTSNPNTDRFLDQVYAWDDITESNNESPEAFWQASYKAIATANQALSAIDELEAKNGKTTALEQARSEALICRAYNHFMLVNVFAKNYNSKTSGTDLGVTYMTEPETTVSPQYERNTVKECYEMIEKDLEAGLPNISDAYMTVPKYHFNPSAAYAFACRFYLYYEKWDKALEYANLTLGASPETTLRDYSAMANMTQTYDAISQYYASSSRNCNLMLTTGFSKMGIAFGPYYTYKRYSHNPYLATKEDATATHAWGTITFWSGVKKYSATNLSTAIFWRLPNMFEYTDPVAGIGYRRCVFPTFTTDETLLNRAEAEVMLKKYDEACSDLNMWLNNIGKTKKALTPAKVQTFYKSVNYATMMTSTVKKHLHPAFEIDEEGSVQESMLQAVLSARRIETLQLGLRWFDIKRYGIVIPRRIMNAAGIPTSVYDSLGVDDPRRAVQIPSKVIDAGYTANPRSGSNSTSSSVIPDGGELTPIETSTEE